MLIARDVMSGQSIARHYHADLLSPSRVNVTLLIPDLVAMAILPFAEGMHSVPYKAALSNTKLLE